MKIKHKKRDTVCNCCVRPMKKILQQLVGKTTILTTENEFFNVNDQGEIEPIEIIAVKGCVVETSVGSFPISQVKGVSVDEIIDDIKLLPIRRSNSACKCIEDPATKLLKNSIGDTVSLSALIPLFALEGAGVEILDVGEGIVLFNIIFQGVPVNAVLSTCIITRVGPFEP
ncbi:hypothetical protein VQL36_04410 [Chengkuizengella sp. SCS-71B]|uniref:hypothetical protein n=1 Tax=Chengkuizengella sp. SCS-71B TaxID=3115290 RepID=UPI0032C22C0C